jgi:hypothetical protein
MITEADGNGDEDSSRADFGPLSKRRCLELPTARSNASKAKELTVGWIVVSVNIPFTAPSNPDCDECSSYTMRWWQKRCRGAGSRCVIPSTAVFWAYCLPCHSSVPLKKDPDSFERVMPLSQRLLWSLRSDKCNIM